MVRLLHNFTAKVMGLIPSFGTKILQATQCEKEKRICNSWEVQGKSQCFHELTTISSKEAHGSHITDVKGFAIKMLVVIIYTLLLIQKSLLHPSKLLDRLVCLVERSLQFVTSLSGVCSSEGSLLCDTVGMSRKEAFVVRFNGSGIRSDSYF